MGETMVVVAPADSAQSSRPLRIAAGMISFDKGARRILSDMIALVHQGEMIIPAGPAATFRRMMGGNSGVALTVHGHHLLASHVDSGLIVPRRSTSESCAIDLLLKRMPASCAS